MPIYCMSLYHNILVSGLVSVAVFALFWITALREQMADFHFCSFYSCPEYARHITSKPKTKTETNTI